MNAIRPTFTLLMLALLLQSCAPDRAGVLRVTTPLPSGVLPRDGSIAFSFSRTMVPPESLNVWSVTPYIEFTPAIPGKFVWQDSTRLVFSPDGLLPGDAHFKGALNVPVLQRLSGSVSFDGENEFDFSTEVFTLRQVEFFYDRMGPRRQVGVKANLFFSYAVNPQDVAATIHLTVDGVERSIERVVSSDPASVIAIEVGTLDQMDKERTIAVGFGDGLVSPETSTRIKLDAPLSFTLPPLADMEIHGHDVGFDGTASWIRITTSQEVDPASVQHYVTIDPVRAYVVEGARDGFILRGAFEPGTTFHLVIRKGLESVLGGVTHNEYAVDVVIGNIQPSFGFASSTGLYMLLGGHRSVDITTVNMPRLLVRVSQVFQNNLVFFLDAGRYYDYSYDDGEEEDQARIRRKYRYYVGNYGRQLMVDTLEIAQSTNKEVTTPFDLAPFLRTDYRGFYVIELSNPAEAWRSTSKLVSISDIGLIVKRSTDEVAVFAVSLVTNAPLRAVRVSLISNTNQVIASDVTDRDGVARFSGLKERSKEFTVTLVTAESEGDFNFVNLADYRVETSRFDVGGKRDVQAAYDAFLYGDRTLYRPGETVRVSGIVRDLAHPVPAGMPVRLTVVNPRGSTIADQHLGLNGEGSFESSFPTQPSAPTGEYRVDLFTGASEFLATYRVSIEDFVPDRLRLLLQSSRDTARPGDTIRYDIQALNFFGPPAAGRTWELEGSFDVMPYVSKTFPDFRFRDDAAIPYKGDPSVFNGRTDREGRASVAYVLPKNLTSTGLLRVRAKVAVFDESGRPVYRIHHATVHPRGYMIGMRNAGAYYVSPNTPQKAQLIAVDMNDRPVDGFRAKVDLVRFEWHSVLRQHQGTQALRYVSEKREILVRSDRVTLGAAPVEYTYSAPRSGEYALRVSKDGDTGYNQCGFYSYSWGTTDVTSFAVDPEARVDIILDKTTYLPGDRARVLFQAPFDGTMLVTVERNGVYRHMYLQVVNNAAAVEIPVEEQYVPNVYVSAVLFRKIAEQTIPLLAGHGFVPLIVENAANRMDVSITAPSIIRPRTTQTVTISTGEKGSCVTLAAVDEGICQVKNYRTPDPHGWFYARKALQTETFDFFRDLLPEPLGRSSTGGGESELALRVNPLGGQRFKPVALWSGIRTAGKDGTAQVTLDIPEFNGELRLMAVAYKGNRFGAAQGAVTVADPVVITPALPRFLSPGDSVLMAITASNTRASSVSLSFDVKTTGGVVRSGTVPGLTLGANEERFVGVPLRATRELGVAMVTVAASAFGETMTSTTELPVRPIAPFAMDAFTGYVDGGTSIRHHVGEDYLTPGRRASIALSPFPVVGLAKRMKSLLGYPHGCLEQVVSKAFPQIYLRDIANQLAPSTVAAGSPTYFVNEAISRVTSMQTFDGTFFYWPGGGTNRWSTVYATHFLQESRRAGYAVPEATLNAALSAVTIIARSKLTEDMTGTENRKTTVRRIADRSCIYALYVLAAAGKAERSVMDFYRNEPGLLTYDTRYLLAGAYGLAGDRRAFSELLPAEFFLEEGERTVDWNFDSPVRANALVLNVLLDTDLNNPAIPRLMEYLSRVYGTGRWFSTQEDAFTMLAFGKAARMAGTVTATGSVTVGETTLAYSGGTKRYDIDPFGRDVTVSIAGQGRVYYSLVVEGVKTEGGITLEDRNLQVRREFLDRGGNPVDPGSVQQNELLVVRVTLNCNVDNLPYIAISDLLPAGMEIENPRLTETADYAFIKNPSVPEYIDIRDDRINIYTGFAGGRRQHVFYYAVRAVTPGVFRHAPIVAEAMYDGRYFSASGGGIVRVRR